MPGVVTPARRAREDDQSDAEEYEVSVDGEGSARSHGSKRARLDNEGSDAGNEDDEESSPGQLLPDSFLRSPKGKGRAVNGLSNGHGPQQHQPGSIVRVTLTNFVTYTNAEFHPGPNLNMIIGPNGTGKSTLVCAICLGLGWETKHLGRAKDIGEFVKHGAKKAVVEIELAADPERHRKNPVISIKITKERNKSDFFIDDKSSTRKSVLALARSFSIQVDNLCQFLPQDRVVEFAALSPVDLLTQTQKAAAPEYMTEWHTELKEMRKEQKQKQAEQQSGLEILKNMENRQKGQEADVERLRERSGLQERIAALEKLRPFPEYNVAKSKHQEAVARKKQAQRELSQLERKMAPNLRAVDDKTHYLERIDKVVHKRKALVERGEGAVVDNKKKISAAEEKIADIAQKIEAERNNMKNTRQSIPRHETTKRAILKAMESPPADFDPAELNEQIREKTRQIRNIDDRAGIHGELPHEIGSINEQAKQRQRIIEGLNTDKNNLHSQAGQQANKLRLASRDAFQAWEWIQSNQNEFKGTVYGPPIVSCSVKDPAHARAVETVINDTDKMAFTVTSYEDFRKLGHQLQDVLRLNNVNIRVSEQPLDSYRAPMSREQLQQYGLECYILDLIEGPEAVLAMLCDNQRINQTAFTTQEVSEDNYNALQRSSVSSWITRTQSYSIVRRREYGDQATSTRVQSLKQARFFTDAPVDHQADQEIDARMRELKGEIGELMEQRKVLIAEGNQLNEDRKQLSEEKKAIEEEKNVKQIALAQFQGLPVKLEKVESQLQDAKNKIKRYRQEQRAAIDRGDALHLQKGQLALDYANSIEALRGLHVQLFEVEILQIEARSELQQIEAQHAEEQRLIEERRRETQELQAIAADFYIKGNQLANRMREINVDLSDFEQEVYNEIRLWMPEQMETEIQSTQARLEMTHGSGNENTLREFEKRAKNIEERRARLYDLSAKLEALEESITNIRERWEPELDGLVAQISDAFAENFSKIQCAGEVAVYKDEDFEQWAIQIKVKFREHEALSVLDSHRQSGGERAVSTIFYLMALQSLARAPFRVVDEINQGMDPRNERLVHSRMVDIACAEHTSQYFLITPKLLNGLKYHPNMKVHCIASGEYMPVDHRELDFGMLAKRALAVRGGGEVRAAA